MRTLILSTIPQFTRGLVVGLAAGGHEVFACTDHPRSAVHWSRLSRHVLSATRQQLADGPDAFIATLNDTIRKRRIDAVIPADTRPTAMLCRRQHDLDAEVFPLDGFDNFDRMRDKQRFAELLDMVGLCQPAHHLIETIEDADTIRFDGPYVVKPPTGEGQAGVCIANNPRDLRAYLRRLGDAELPRLVQSHIPGRDIDLSFLADHGELVAWTTQRPVPGQRGVLEFLDHPGVLDAGRRLCAATKFHGVAHLDLRIDERNQDVHLIESNPRFWASARYAYAMGVNFVDLGLKLMRGQRPARPFTPPVGRCGVPGFTPRRWALAMLGLRDGDSTSAMAKLLRLTDTDPLPDMVEYAQRMPKPWKRGKSHTIELPNVADQAHAESPASASRSRRSTRTIAA